jgi:hypothetical protein
MLVSQARVPLAEGRMRMQVDSPLHAWNKPLNGNEGAFDLDAERLAIRWRLELVMWCVEAGGDEQWEGHLRCLETMLRLEGKVSTIWDY